VREPTQKVGKKKLMNDLELETSNLEPKTRRKKILTDPDKL